MNRALGTTLSIVAIAHGLTAAACELIARRVAHSPGDDNPAGMLAVYGVLTYLALAAASLGLAVRWRRSAPQPVVGVGLTVALALPLTLWVFLAQLVAWWWQHG